MLWVTFSPAPECVEVDCWIFKIWPRRGPRDSVVVVGFCAAVKLSRGRLNYVAGYFSENRFFLHSDNLVDNKKSNTTLGPKFYCQLAPFV
jgi:hypothetical protein